MIQIDKRNGTRQRSCSCRYAQTVEKAKIALINSALEIEKTEMSAEIRINDAQQMQRFLDEENKMLKSMVDKIKTAGANVVVSQKGIDEMAQHYLSSSAILAVSRVKESDMYKLSKATGAEIVNNLDDLDAQGSGYCGPGRRT